MCGKLGGDMTGLKVFISVLMIFVCISSFAFEWVPKQLITVFFDHIRDGDIDDFTMSYDNCAYPL